MFDFVRPALWAGGLALIILLLCSAYVVLANAGSRNLGLGLGALFGACIIFAVQLWFELQSTQTITDFPAQFVVDFKDKSIRKHPVVLSEAVGAFVNQEANALMAGANPSFCEIFFSFQGEFLEKQSSLPDFGAQQVLLPDGSPRYESVTHGIRATVTYFALRAQDRKIKAYQAWAARVVEGSRRCLNSAA